MRKINLIVVHCTATRSNTKVTIEDLTQWHKARGFKTIGYHFVISQNGVVHNGRPLSDIGAHVEGMNANSIGICYIGGLNDKTSKPEDTRTPAQKESLLELLSQLKRVYPGAKICGHRDCSPDTNHNGKIDKWEYLKDCPCFDAIPEYEHL
ncbi:MAG: N-acetylmuramoyl-L-alanine amidase [Bacteroidales bacterium]|nr:N-acetylmuramoyl-L-alanine amidase [Bacteroidales bacterium]